MSVVTGKPGDGGDAPGALLSVIEHLPIGVHLYRLEPGDRLVFVGANPAADQILGVDNRQFVGKTIEEAFPPLAGTEVPRRYRLAAAGGELWETEQVAYHDDVIVGAFSVRAFPAGHGMVAAAFFDITERKRAEEALRESRALYHDLVETAQDLIWQVDAEGRYTYLNPAWEEVLGYRVEEMLGRPFSDFQRPEDAARDRGQFAGLLGGKVVRGLETVHLAKDGHPVNLLFNAKVFTDKDGRARGTRGTAFDITGRVKAERALRESEALLAESQRVARIGHYQLDAAAGRWTSSPVLDEIFGIGAAYDRDVTGWLGIVHPEEREAMGAYFVGEVLGRRQPFNREYRIQRPADGAVRWVHGLGALEFDAAGRPAKMFGTIQDITERKESEAERRRLEQQILHAQKLESLGVLAGGIAHDFNNILTAVIGNAGLARLRLETGSPALENLRQIELAAGRAADLARQMLAYSGKGRFRVEALDLNQLVEEMEQMLRVSISKKAILRLSFARPLPAVDADATQLHQVVMNLVINASEAIGEGDGVITISTGSLACSREFLQEIWLDERLPEGRYVTLEVADTGCGMDKETLARIFDPFFTTKFTGRGLGMAAVLGIVRGHRGAIKAYSEPGRGTTFKVFFPAGLLQPPAPREQAPQTPWSGSGTALLVDDEEGVRAIAAAMLRELGFDVVTACDGAEAIERYREGRPDLVLLDLTMPHLDGEQAFRELRALDPSARVLLSSGYNELEVAQRFAGRGLAGFIQKPYTFEALRAALRAALG